MRRAIEKASVLIEALPFIQQFHGEVVVVKFGGSIMQDERAVRSILLDVAFMACVGMRPVIVHGGGKAISAGMSAAGLKARFVQGLRVTDEVAIGVVEHILNQEVNPQIVNILEAAGCKSRGLHGDDILEVEKKTAIDPDSGEVLDWGFVGCAKRADVAPVQAFLGHGITPVVTPLGRGVDRKVYNVNADESAAILARELKARKLVFLSDVPGLLQDVEDPDSLLSTVRTGEIEELTERGVISGGMLPKINGGMHALHAGVKKIHIIEAALPHSLLLELFTERGIGTEIIA